MKKSLKKKKKKMLFQFTLFITLCLFLNLEPTAYLIKSSYL